MKCTNVTGVNRAKLLLIGASLMLLAGCSWFGKKENENQAMANAAGMAGAGCNVADDPLVLEGEVLVSMQGKPVVSTKSFERHYNKLLEDNPQYKEFLARSSEAKKNALNGLASQAVIDEYVCRNGLDKSAAYQEELKWLIHAQKRMLNLKYFTDRMNIAVTDDEVRDAYEKNKDVMPQLLISRGGVKAMGIPFDKEADANEFVKKIGKQNLEEAAKANGMADKVRDFKLVHAGSFGIDPVVRDAVVAFKAFPVTKVIKGKDDKFWVVYASGTEEKQYRPFNEVKDGMRAFVEREKGMKIFEAELERLKKEYGIIVNDAAFGSTPNQENSLQDLEKYLNEEIAEQQVAKAA